MKPLKIVTGLMLALVVSATNGIAGLGYIVGGEFEMSLNAAFGNEAASDPRWKSEQVDERTVTTPRDEKAALSLLLETKHGRFGLFLQMVCLFQFIAGAIIVFHRTAGIPLAAFLVLTAFLGAGAELVGARLSSSLGITNTIGLVVSALLLMVTYLMLRTPGAQSQVGQTP
ncbi:MAG: hypothetical protein GWN84_26690 [Gammaproteobacteria bacterium]|nr:hypothetical protein [Gammaproteobacteria bacterium]NIR85985.1 hypothetical protein [Gammaproteobacteria bacterium]NIR91976.1 hypothetical protein [Gammaproteobacteria bacterium]NIU07226.1 hypothetical protein [Gammaproteobacteria bacterium]NIV54029.1 hypothetical protein [Gammaproteobacteria bacterium]